MTGPTSEQTQIETDASGNGRSPDGPTELGTGAWVGVLKRSARGFSADNLTDWAAALTYYGIQAIFPALLALVSILGLVGKSATQPLIQNLDKVAPGPAEQIFTSAIRNLQQSRGAAGALVIVGIGLALWSASGYVGAFMRASNAIYGVRGGSSVLAQASDSGGGHTGACDPAGSERLGGCAHRRTGYPGRESVGDRRERGNDLGSRKVARAAPDRRRDVLDPVLGRA